MRQDCKRFPLGICLQDSAEKYTHCPKFVWGIFGITPLSCFHIHRDCRVWNKLPGQCGRIANDFPWVYVYKTLQKNTHIARNSSGGHSASPLFCFLITPNCVAWDTLVGPCAGIAGSIPRIYSDKNKNNSAWARCIEFLLDPAFWYVILEPLIYRKFNFTSRMP